MYLCQEVELKKLLQSEIQRSEGCAYEKAVPLFEVIYQTAQDEKNDLSVETLCDIARVSWSGYYAWEAAIHDRARREAEDQADFKLILIAYNKRGYIK